MKKLLILISFFTFSVHIGAQPSQINRLKKKLQSHPQQDTVRANLLNDLASQTFMGVEKRKAYAEEALTISRNINYVNGQASALAVLGSVAGRLNNLHESKSMFFLADSIANLTGNTELKADLLWRKSFIEPDPVLKDSLLQQAHSLAVKTGKLDLQAFILMAMARNTEDEWKQKILYLRADSIAQKAGDLYLQANINKEMAGKTMDLQERKALYSHTLLLAEKFGDLQYLTVTLIAIGNNLASTGDKDAINYFIQAEETAQKSGNKVTLSSVQGSIGDYYLSTRSDYAKAMEYYLKALSSAETSNDTVSMIVSRIDLGALHCYLGDSEIALKYLLKAKEANKELGDQNIEANLQNILGENYRISGEYSEAITAYYIALKIDNSVNSGKFAYFYEGNLADVYTRIDSLDLAFRYGFESLKAVKEKGDINSEGWLSGILSRAYLKKNMVDSAIYYGNLGLAASKEIGTIEYMRDNTLALANAYAAKKDFANAYANQTLYLEYRDSMMNEEVRNRTAVQQYTFNLDKKEAQIAVLHEQKKGQSNLLTGAVALLSLILVLAVLLLLNNRQKQKANVLLEKQKEEIDQKAQNVELLSDIGRKTTSSLSIEKIIGTVYKNINTLMDANVFGIGIYNIELNSIEFPSTYENGEPLSFYSNSVDDENRFGSISFKSGKEIVINDLNEEYKNHINSLPSPYEGGQTLSIIFLPLVSKGKKLGVITVQSFKDYAYSDYQLFMLRNIATYAAIAIENADAYETLSHTLSTLKDAQAQLIQSEKMASLGELTAGIAHEIQNPLNFVNNFSELSNELLAEMLEELKNGDTEEVSAIVSDVIQNLEKINYHGKRADAIVKGMLQHARIGSGSKELTEINALADEYLRLAYHGLRAKDKSFNVAFKTEFDTAIGKINIVPQDFGRVFLNLFNNAFYACSERARVAKNESLEDGKADFEPNVLVFTKRVDDHIEIGILDNGIGIPLEIVDKIYQPFFTTKPTGEGTGLGLSMSYDIIKVHGGEIKIQTQENEGTLFTILLPLVD